MESQNQSSELVLASFRDDEFEVVKVVVSLMVSMMSSMFGEGVDSGDATLARSLAEVII